MHGGEDAHRGQAHGMRDGRCVGDEDGTLLVTATARGCVFTLRGPKQSRSFHRPGNLTALAGDDSKRGWASAPQGGQPHTDRSPSPRSFLLFVHKGPAAFGQPPPP